MGVSLSYVHKYDAREYSYSKLDLYALTLSLVTIFGKK